MLPNQPCISLRKRGCSSAAKEKGLRFFIILYFITSALNMSIKMLIPMSSAMWSLLSRAFMIFLLITLIFTISTAFQKCLSLFCIVELSVLALFLITVARGATEDSVLLNMIFQTMGVFIPIGIYVFCIDDYTAFFNSLRRASYFMSTILILTLVVSVNGKVAYSMPLAYSLVIPVFVQFREYIRVKSILGLAFAVAGSVAVLLFGARGPLVCILSYFIWSMFYGRKDIEKNWAKLAALLILGILLAVFANEIVTGLNSFLQSHGIYSRTLTTATQNRFFGSTGRNDLWVEYLGRIAQKPLFGWGLGGGWISASEYPHNIFLELILNFGILLGGALIILLCGVFVWCLTHIRTVFDECVAIFAVASLQFLMSGSFLLSPIFFMFLFLSVKQMKCANAECKHAKK